MGSEALFLEKNFDRFDANSFHTLKSNEQDVSACEHIKKAFCAKCWESLLIQTWFPNDFIRNTSHISGFLESIRCNC